MSDQIPDPARSWGGPVEPPGGPVQPPGVPVPPPGGPVQPSGGPPPAPGYQPPAGPSGPRAGFGKRLVAALIDGILLSIVGYIIGSILGQDVTTVEDGTAIYALDGPAAGLSLVLQLAYYVSLEGGRAGATLGKKAMGIRVIDARAGGSIGYGRAFIRWIGRFVSALPCLLGYFWMLWDNNKQTWHDKFANAIVVPTDAYPVD